MIEQLLKKPKENVLHLILHHFLDLLDAAAAKGDLDARFRVFPMVNPVGMANLNFGQHQGRYNPATGINHNRRWPAIGPQLPDDLGDRLEVLRAGILDADAGLIRELTKVHFLGV